MLCSMNLRRGTVPLTMRLRIDDLQAQLAPLERDGLPGLSFAITNGLCALTRALCGALYRDEL